MATSPSTNYIIERSPDFYGGKQEDYLKFADQSINEGIVHLTSGIGAKKNPSELFFELLHTYQENRHEIALRHQTPRAEYFGTPRISKQTPEAGLALTGLYEKYETHNTLFKEQLAPLLSKMKHDLRGFSQKNTSVTEKCLGRVCKFAIEVKDAAETKELTSPPSEAEVQAALGTEKSYEEIQNNYDLMLRIKTEHFDWYQKLTMHRVLYEIYKAFPSPKILSFEEGRCIGNTGNFKNLYVIGTLRIQIGSKLYAISRYVTWLYTNYRTDPVDRMLEHSKVFIVHQDTFLIDETLQEISRIFADAVRWDHQKDSLQALKNNVALIRFLFAHCMPSARGDGAIGDWLELTLYRYHGFSNTRYNPNRLPCFEALSTLSLSQYLRNYEKTITVE